MQSNKCDSSIVEVKVKDIPCCNPMLGSLTEAQRGAPPPLSTNSFQHRSYFYSIPFDVALDEQGDLFCPGSDRDLYTITLRLAVLVVILNANKVEQKFEKCAQGRQTLDNRKIREWNRQTTHSYLFSDKSIHCLAKGDHSSRKCQLFDRFSSSLVVRAGVHAY